MEPNHTTGSSEAREIAVVKYFTRTPARPTYSLATVLGTFAAIGVLFLLYLSFNRLDARDELAKNCFDCVSIPILGIVVICATIAAASRARTRDRYREAWHRAEPKPTDAQIDEWHAGDLERLRAHALDKLDLVWEQVAQDNPEGPLMVEGPGPSPAVRVGADRVIRFSIHEVLIVYLTKYHLAAYKCTISLIDGVIKSESTQEYHYNDVVSVSTQTDNSGLTWYVEGERRQIPSFQKFALSVASGEQISVVIRPATTEMMSGNDMPESGSDKAIRAIRTRLREKKGGTIEGGRGADPSVL